MGRVGLRSLKTRLRLDGSSERREKVLTPDVVVITEPTNLGVYRGHRGRMKMEIRTQGLSCHGSAPITRPVTNRSSSPRWCCARGSRIRRSSCGGWPSGLCRGGRSREALLDPGEVNYVSEFLRVEGAG